MNQRLVACLFGGMFCGLSAGIYAVWAGWGILAGLALYSGVGSVSLLFLAMAASMRLGQSARSPRRPAFA